MRPISFQGVGSNEGFLASPAEVGRRICARPVGRACGDKPFKPLLFHFGIEPYFATFLSALFS
jgi:hypothetical protein